MKPRKKGQQFEIIYRCSGYPKPFYERFSTYEEANLRIAQIEYEKSIGVFVPPKPTQKVTHQTQTKFITVAELMDEYVRVYGLNHWSDSTLSYNRHRIEHYIKPYIGTMAVKDITTRDLDIYYDSLQDKPAVILKGHTKTDSTISACVISKIHALLRSALNQAVVWEYIKTNPAERATLPKYRSKPRTVWSPAEAQYALECCTDPMLNAAMQLALGCSMRIGEILGLTWDCVDYSDEAIENGTARVEIVKELKRCDKSSLDALECRKRSAVVFTFPEQKQTGTTTSLVLKAPKTESSIRVVFLPKTVAFSLRKVKEKQEQMKQLLGEAYCDYNLVIAHEYGHPYEQRHIAKLFKNLIDENGLTPVVFHSLRHCSASMKLRIGGGNIKAVQGDTGHSQSRMVTDLYAHIYDEDRRILAQKVDEQFFQRSEKHSNSASNNDTDTAYRLIQDNPDIAKLLVAAMQKNSA